MAKQLLAMSLRVSHERYLRPEKLGTTAWLEKMANIWAMPTYIQRESQRVGQGGRLFPSQDRENGRVCNGSSYVLVI